MFGKRSICLLAVLFVAAACSSRPVSAQLGGADLPDLSGLAGAIEKSTKNAPPPTPPTPGTLYHSGLSVPSVHPGAAAKAIVHALVETSQHQHAPSATITAMQNVEAGMPKTLSDFEAYLETNGFAKRDLGVASGVFFTMNWQTANKLTLSDSAEVTVVRAVSDNVAVKYKAKFAGMTSVNREKTYESLLTGSLLLRTFAQVSAKAGKTAAEADARKAAGALFKKVVGIAPDMVDISPDGKVTGSAPTTAVPSATDTPPLVDSPNYTGLDPATPSPPGTDTPPTDTPASPGKPSARALPPGRGVKPSQIAGVYAVQEVRIGVGGGFSQPFIPVLALKDGTYTEDFDAPPSDLDLADSRRRHAYDWGHWRTNAASAIRHFNGSAKHIQTLNNKGVWEATDWIGPLEGGKPGLRLSGICKASGGGGSAGSGFAYGYEQVYTFFPDGRYLYGQSAGFSSDGGDNGSVAGSTQTVQPKRGTYAIANYGIILRETGGTVKRLSFARTPDGLVFMGGYAHTMDNSPSVAKPRKVRASAVSLHGGVSESQIAGIYCQPAYGSGAGGGVSVSYEPILALKDGTYCGGFDVPPSEFDVAASRRSRPGQWGRWRRTNGTIETQKRGGWEKSGWIGPLPPSGPGQTLSGRYTSVSGGGNSALGGGITIGIEDSFTFLPGGRFVSGHTNSVSSASVAGGASRSASGTYAISRNAITLRYAGGPVKRWSYAKTKDGLVFLHGIAYVDDK